MDTLAYWTPRFCQTPFMCNSAHIGVQVKRSAPNQKCLLSPSQETNYVYIISTNFLSRKYKKHEKDMVK